MDNTNAHRDRFLCVDAEMSRIQSLLREDFPDIFLPDQLRGCGGLDVTDGTGITRGNADLAASCTWSPPANPPERVPQVYPLPPEIER